ncbi:MAG: protease modulator HflC [Alphaproteobacteria bacterium]|jgi:membrane protease subunit HflC|nr:protease modulator HflC [Alphaproteobacteria bacterium]
MTYLGLLLGLLAFVGAGSLYTVNQIQQAIILQFGKPMDVVKDPGLHWKLPFIWDVEHYDKRVLDFNLPLEEPIAADQKKMLIDSFARYRITDPLKVFQTVRTETVIRQRIDALINSAMRSVVGQVPLTSLLSQEREQIMRDIRDQVNAETAQFGIEVIDVRIRRADLPEANSQAVYERMKSQREQEAKKIRSEGSEAAQRIRAAADRDKIVILADARREGEILRGEGEAESTRIYAEAANRDPEFYDFYRSLLAFRRSMEKQDTSMVLAPGSEFLRYFGKTPGSLDTSDAP